MKRVLLFLVIGFLLMTLPFSTQAQCQVRTDWSTITVVSGDTLARIARRYGISVRDLAAANCLTNINLIYRGQRLRVPTSGTSNVPSTVPNQPSYAYVSGTHQEFENGMMIWRADTGDIWVLFYNGNRQAIRYSASFYGSLSNTVNVGTTPPNRIRPILGFGRVWSSVADVRTRLGWAIGGEQFAQISFSDPGGTLSVYREPRSWLWIYPSLQIWGNEPSNLPTPTPALSTVPQIFAFTVNPTAVFVGDSVALSWDMRGVQYVGIEVNNAATSPEPDVVLDNLSLSGTTYFSIPSDYGGAAFTLYGENRLSNGVVERLVQQRADLVVNTYPVSAFPVQAAYQTYDNGFMIWRADTEDIYVFYNNGAVETYPEALYAAYSDSLESVPTPPGKIRPVSGFGRVWWGYSLLTSLGWATTPEQGYTMTIETLFDGFTSFALPTGRSLKWYRGVWVWNPV